MNESRTTSRGSAVPGGGSAEAGVAQRLPEPRDIDSRLRELAPRMVLDQVAADHDAPSSGACPCCGWLVGGGQRSCPSRVLARCVRDRRPVPAWLVGLVPAVPGALAPRVPVLPQQRQATEDALPGLFDAPERVAPEGADGVDGRGGVRS